MAAPTLRDYVESSYSDAGTSETSGAALDWSASGDLVLALGITEDNTRTLSTPTATGLTFAAMSGSPTNTASSCKGYAWSATASGSGSQTVSAASDGAAAKRGISVWAWGDSGGFGTPVINIGTGKTVSVTVAGPDSTVVMVLGDWNATTDVTFTTVPAGGTVREATSNAGEATFLVIEWVNQAAGTRSYGADTDWTGTATITKIAVEVKGVGGTDATVSPSVIAAIAAFPSASKSTGSAVTPAAIAAVTALPTATKQTGSTLAPGVVAAIAALPAAAAGAGSGVAPAVVAVVASVPAVGVRTGSTVTPAAVAAVAELPGAAVQAGGNASISAATIEAQASMPAAATRTGVTLAPAVIVTTAGTPSVAVWTGVTLAPAVLAAVATLPAASTRTGVGVTPVTITAGASMPAATVTTGTGRVYTRLGGQLAATALRGALRLGGASVPFS